MMTINDYYRAKKDKPQRPESNYKKISDFYVNFIEPMLPNPKTVSAFHKLLVKYYNDPEAIFLIRKYESTKKNDVWDNRRGAVTRFTDDFEYVFASNFLADQIYMMVYNDFVPSYDDFKQMIKSRSLKLAGGTEVEKAIRSYPPIGKTLDYYLAHIEGVNGCYLRSSGGYSALNREESAHIYPRGEKEDWLHTPNRIRIFKEYCLTDEEKNIAKAHFLRFLDPMNFFITPKVKDFSHSIENFTKNIGELAELVDYVKKQYAAIYGAEFFEFLRLAKADDCFDDSCVLNNSNNLVINGTYSVDINSKANQSKSKSDKETKSDQPMKEKIINAPALSFGAYLRKWGLKNNTVNSYCSATNRVNKVDTLTISNIEYYIEHYRINDTDKKTTHNALKRYYEYLIYLELMNSDSIEADFIENKKLEKLLIPASIQRLGNRCFNEYLTEIFFEEGSLNASHICSGSNIFEKCVKLKKVFSDTVESLRFKYDTNGHPYFQNVKVFVGNEPVSPVVSLNIKEGFSVFQIKSKHISEIHIVDSICNVTYMENSKTTDVTIQISPNDYYGLVEIMHDINRNVVSMFTRDQPTVLDASSPSEVGYSFLGEESFGTTFWVNNDSYVTTYLKDILQRICSDNLGLI